MGVTGLWRLLDMSAKPMSLDNFRGMRIAIDIHPHLNRLLHSSRGTNWLFYVMKDLFSIMNFNIKIIIVLPGRKPTEKIFQHTGSSRDEEEAYHRVRSAIQRAATQRMHQNLPVTKDENPLTLQEPLNLSSRVAQGISYVPEPVQNPDDPLRFSREQLSKMARRSKESSEAAHPKLTIHHPMASTSFIFAEEIPEKKERAVEEPDFSVLNEPSIDDLPKGFHSDFLMDVAELLTSSDREDPDDGESVEKESKPSISLEPAGYLAPLENYVTAAHLNQLKAFCQVFGIPIIDAPEEACAECAKLELDGFVDAVASDDNNTILFGSEMMIRNIFFRPVSITLKSLQEVGLTRDRLLNIAMMIDGDYNNDIRRRLFTVGPVRALQIVAHFPDPIQGLLQFKEWWIRVVKDKGVESDSDLIWLARRKWIQRLVVPVDFPPENLYNALKNPVVSNTPVIARIAAFNIEEAVKFMVRNSTAQEAKIREFVNGFKKASKDFKFNYTLNRFMTNELHVPQALERFLLLLQKYDHSQPKCEIIIDEDISLPSTTESEIGSDSISEGEDYLLPNKQEDKNTEESSDEFETVI